MNAGTDTKAWTAEPKLFGEGRATGAQVRAYLRRATRYLTRGGEWTDELRAYVDRWLDALCAELDDELERMPEADPGHDSVSSARRA